MISISTGQLIKSTGLFHPKNIMYHHNYVTILTMFLGCVLVSETRTKGGKVNHICFTTSNTNTNTIVTDVKPTTVTNSHAFCLSVVLPAVKDLNKVVEALNIKINDKSGST